MLLLSLLVLDASDCIHAFLRVSGFFTLTDVLILMYGILCTSLIFLPCQIIFCCICKSQLFSYFLLTNIGLFFEKGSS